MYISRYAGKPQGCISNLKGEDQNMDNTFNFLDKYNTAENLIREKLSKCVKKRSK